MNNGQIHWGAVPGLPGVQFGSTDAQFDRSVDPTKGMSGMPPNMGDFVLPHVTTFQGMFSSVAKVYRASDEAIKDSFDNARIMRNDVTVMECVEMRQRAVALLDWSIEPEDTKNAEHVAFCAELEKIVRKIPRFMQYQENLLHATWYGKYANEHRWGKNLINNSMRSLPMAWLPINGDKIVFRFDDGIGDHRPDQIGIRVAQTNRGLKGTKSRKIEPTDRGMAYFLDTWERPLIALHKYRIEDGEYEEPSNAGRVHGVGVRSVIYWTWYQKQETLAYLMEYLERSAGGVELWYYPLGNAQAEAATRTAAEQRIANGRNVILVPRPTGEDSAMYGVERFEASMAGADALKSIITEYFGHAIKRYILGQTLTTEASATGLGSNLADIHMDTFMQIVRYDSMLLEETIDTDLLAPIVAFNFPKMIHVPIHFRKSLTEPDSESLLNALKSAYEMGLRIPAETVRDLVGAPKPDVDDEVLDKMAQMKQEQEAAMQQAGAMGLGGQPGQPQGGPPQAAQQPAATPPAQAVEQAEYMASEVPSENSERQRVETYRKDGQTWNEEDHPRDGDGKFSEGGGASHVDTPEFKQWFGKSKIVGSDGKPQRMYHGTKAQFNKFDMERAGESSLAAAKTLSQIGAWFTPKRDIAQKFAERAPGDESTKIMDCFLKIEKPFEWDWSTTTARDISPGERKGSVERAVKEIKSRGHDGIIFRNIDDRGGVQDQYVVFEPNQIKSATGNRGTFDPDDDRIDYAAGEIKRDSDGKFAPLDLTGWDKPINQPASLKGQQALFEEIDPSAIGSAPKSPKKPTRDPRQKALFQAGQRGVAERIRAANRRRKPQPV